MLGQKADPVLANSLRPDVSHFFQLGDVTVNDPKGGVRHGVQERGGSLAKVTCSDDKDLFVFQLLGQW